MRQLVFCVRGAVLCLGFHFTPLLQNTCHLPLIPFCGTNIFSLGSVTSRVVLFSRRWSNSGAVGMSPSTDTGFAKMWHVFSLEQVMCYVMVMVTTFCHAACNPPGASLFSLFSPASWNPHLWGKEIFISLGFVGNFELSKSNCW